MLAPRLLIPLPTTAPTLVVLVYLPASLLELVLLAPMFMHLLMIVLVACLPVTVFVFVLNVLLLVAVLACWPACAYALLLLLLILLTPACTCHAAQIYHPGSSLSSSHHPTFTLLDPPTTIRARGQRRKSRAHPVRPSQPHPEQCSLCCSAPVGHPLDQGPLLWAPHLHYAHPNGPDSSC